MKRVGLGTTLCLLALAAQVRADDSEDPGAPKKECVAVSTEARYSSYGYDHIVTLRSACPTPQRCEVKTDAAPNPVSVELGATDTKSLVTFKGSPAREFKADVKCKAAS